MLLKSFREGLYVTLGNSKIDATNNKSCVSSSSTTKASKYLAQLGLASLEQELLLLPITQNSASSSSPSSSRTWNVALELFHHNALSQNNIVSSSSSSSSFLKQEQFQKRKQDAIARILVRNASTTTTSSNPSVLRYRNKMKKHQHQQNRNQSIETATQANNHYFENQLIKVFNNNTNSSHNDFVDAKTDSSTATKTTRKKLWLSSFYARSGNWLKAFEMYEKSLLSVKKSENEYDLLRNEVVVDLLLYSPSSQHHHLTTVSSFDNNNKTSSTITETMMTLAKILPTKMKEESVRTSFENSEWKNALKLCQQLVSCCADVVQDNNNFLYVNRVELVQETIRQLAFSSSSSSSLLFVEVILKSLNYFQNAFSSASDQYNNFHHISHSFVGGLLLDICSGLKKNPHLYENKKFLENFLGIWKFYWSCYYNYCDDEKRRTISVVPFHLSRAMCYVIKNLLIQQQFFDIALNFLSASKTIPWIPNNNDSGNSNSNREEEGTIVRSLRNAAAALSTSKLISSSEKEKKKQKTSNDSSVYNEKAEEQKRTKTTIEEAISKFTVKQQQQQSKNEKTGVNGSDFLFDQKSSNSNDNNIYSSSETSTKNKRFNKLLASVVLSSIESREGRRRRSETNLYGSSSVHTNLQSSTLSSFWKQALSSLSNALLLNSHQQQLQEQEQDTNKTNTIPTHLAVAMITTNASGNWRTTMELTQMLVDRLSTSSSSSSVVDVVGGKQNSNNNNIDKNENSLLLLKNESLKLATIAASQSLRQSRQWFAALDVLSLLSSSASASSSSCESSSSSSKKREHHHSSSSSNTTPMMMLQREVSNNLISASIQSSRWEHALSLANLIMDSSSESSSSTISPSRRNNTQKSSSLPRSQIFSIATVAPNSMWQKCLRNFFPDNNDDHSSSSSFHASSRWSRKDIHSWLQLSATHNSKNILSCIEAVENNQLQQQQKQQNEKEEGFNIPVLSLMRRIDHKNGDWKTLLKVMEHFFENQKEESSSIKLLEALHICLGAFNRCSISNLPSNEIFLQVVSQSLDEMMKSRAMFIIVPLIIRVAQRFGNSILLTKVFDEIERKVFLEQQTQKQKEEEKTKGTKKGKGNFAFGDEIWCCNIQLAIAKFDLKDLMKVLLLFKSQQQQQQEKEQPIILDFSSQRNIYHSMLSSTINTLFRAINRGILLPSFSSHQQHQEEVNVSSSKEFIVTVPIRNNNNNNNKNKIGIEKLAEKIFYYKKSNNNQQRQKQQQHHQQREALEKIVHYKFGESCIDWLPNAKLKIIQKSSSSFSSDNSNNYNNVDDDDELFLQITYSSPSVKTAVCPKIISKLFLPTTRTSENIISSSSSSSSPRESERIIGGYVFEKPCGVSVDNCIFGILSSSSSFSQKQKQEKIDDIYNYCYYSSPIVHYEIPRDASGICVVTFSFASKKQLHSSSFSSFSSFFGELQGKLQICSWLKFDGSTTNSSSIADQQYLFDNFVENFNKLKQENSFLKQIGMKTLMMKKKEEENNNKNKTTNNLFEELEKQLQEEDEDQENNSNNNHKAPKILVQLTIGVGNPHEELFERKDIFTGGFRVIEKMIENLGREQRLIPVSRKESSSLVVIGISGSFLEKQELRQQKEVGGGDFSIECQRTLPSGFLV